MLFPTIDFGLFFICVFCASWALAARQRKYLLFAASYFFYGYWDWRFLGLILFSSLVNYVAGRLLGRAQEQRDRRLLLTIAVGINLSVLGYFKYAGFMLDTLSDLLWSIGLQRDIPIFQVLLPVGISFFTFQGMSYVVDVYREQIPACRSFLDLGLYISFFPQLVAGPIVRAGDFLPQLASRPTLTPDLVGRGLYLVLLGLFKKMVVANYLAVLIVDEVFLTPAAVSSVDLMVALYAYAVQIYCDFSGYSDIAIGVAALLGYRFKPNFDQPYRAASLREFWRRWHMSLSQWLRDYLYKSLGGSRRGTLRTYRNVMITMLLGGLWHGAAMTFVMWGFLHGIALAAERALGRREPGENTAGRLIGVLVTFHIVCLGWIFFRCESFAIALDYLAALAALTGDIAYTTPFVAGLVAVSLAGQFVPARYGHELALRLGGCGVVARTAAFSTALLAIAWVSPPGTAPFIYFQF